MSTQLFVNSTVHLSVWDRVRVLFNARLKLETIVECEIDPGKTSASTNTIIGVITKCWHFAQTPKGE